MGCAKPGLESQISLIAHSMMSSVTATGWAVNGDDITEIVEADGAEGAGPCRLRGRI